MTLDPAQTEPFAAWPWRRPAGRATRAAQRPSADPEMEALEREVGLTAQIVRRWAHLVPEILGPLRHAPCPCRPLSLEGGRLRAVSLRGVPDVPDWQAWLADVEHVQTDSPEVCAALADGRRSFVVRSPECARVVRAVTPPELVQEVTDRSSEDRPPWIAAPDLDEGFLPLVRLAHRVWLCWDRDEERPAVVVEGKGRPHHVGRGSDRMSSTFGPEGPLPYAAHAPPDAPRSHLAAAGARWAAAVSRTHWLPQLVTAPGNRWAIAVHADYKEAPFADEFAWWWVHHPERDPAEVPDGHRWHGSVVSVELIGQRSARVRWSGDHHVLRLRGGALTAVAKPQTLARAMLRAGHSREELAAQQVPDVVMGGFGTASEVVDVPLEPGDRLLVCTDKTLRVAGLEELTRLLEGDLRRGANELQLALEAAQVADVALFLTPESTSDFSHPGWFPRLALSLVPLDKEDTREPDYYLEDSEKTDPHDAPQRFGIYRGHSMQQRLVGSAPPMWIEALQGALRAYDFAPQRGDIFRARTSLAHAVQLQFDGEAWRPIGASLPQCARVAEGRLAFREDAPSPRLDALIQRAGREREILVDQLEAVALADGFTEFALWLRLTRAHMGGEPAAGLELAREQVSLRARARLAYAQWDREVYPHRVEVASLFAHPTHFHGCVVRYRSLVSEGLERMFTAGAWWSPVPEPKVCPPFRSYFAEVQATWLCDGRNGYGHMGQSRAEAIGRATPLPLPEHPRRVTAEQIRRRQVRRGVPLRAELVLSVDGYLWTWEGHDVRRPSGIPREEPSTFRADVIFALLEGLVVLDVLSRTEITP